MSQEASHADEKTSKHGQKKDGGLWELAMNTTTFADVALLVFGTVAAIISGALNPIMTVVYGSLAGTFRDFIRGTSSADTLRDKVSELALYFVFLAIAQFVSSYIATVIFPCAGERIVQRLREQYLRAILRQEMAFFDVLGAGELTTRITSDATLVQEALSGKASLFLSAASMFVTAIIVSFVRNWKLALIMCSVVVAIVGIMSVGSAMVTKFALAQIGAYGEAASLAQEALSSVKQVKALGIQQRLSSRYESHLGVVRSLGLRVRIAAALMIGAMMGAIHLSYGLALWQGVALTARNEANLSQIVTILLAIVMGAFALGNVAPHAQAFATGVAAARKLQDTISLTNPFDPLSSGGLKPLKAQGHLQFRDVRLCYPSRPTAPALDGLSFEVSAGSTVALVGPSGSGKSSVVSLLERFYEPTDGQVLLDGNDISALNMRWLRSNVRLVSQEPTLFDATVFENIRLGLAGTPHENASADEVGKLVHAAARKARAYDFISALPNGFDAMVGEGGSLLSGGQRQRIAIARAIVSDPPILILDEATAALDSQTERGVQDALDAAAGGRTSIVVAHRLSTIVGADRIVVVAKGRVVEQGTHAELIEQGGMYHDLVSEQQRASANGEEPIARDDAQDNGLTEKKEAPTTTTVDQLDGSDASSTKTERPLTTKRIMALITSLSTPEWRLALLGLFCSVIAGLTAPVQAVFFAQSLSELSLQHSSPASLISRMNLWCLMYLMLGIVALCAWLCQGACFAVCTERLVWRARSRAFRAMLDQSVAFFDRPENASGSLVAFLADGATELAMLGGATLGTLLTATVTLLGGVVLALAVGWKLALVCIATIPFVLGCGWLRLKCLSLLETRSRAAYSASAQYACEAASAIRTVASLTLEQHVWQRYHASLSAQRRRSLRSTLRSAALYALSQSVIFLCAGLAFWYGGRLLASPRDAYSVLQFFVCFAAVVAGAQSAGAILSYAPDMGKAAAAARRLAALLDAAPGAEESAQHCSPSGAAAIDGAVELRDVYFTYPGRREPVLRGVNMSVRPGQFVALVGASGSGKSTVIGLLERFFEPSGGAVLVDGRPVAELDVHQYRRTLALVGQDLVLYSGTIRDNISLASVEQGSDVSQDDIDEACKKACIYDFICSLPDGFDTFVGNRGCMLSGGQKQRIAIARALLRDPRVLLLDEATSALDTQSEQVVQAALDSAAKGRTTIAVAHRLSSVRNAERIYVFDQGRVVENGAHDELMARRGAYYELAKLQGLE